MRAVGFSSLLTFLSLLTSFSPSLPASDDTPLAGVYSPGLVSEEGEGLLEVELEVDTGGEMTLGDLTGGEVGDGDPAGSWGLSWS